MKLPIPMFPLDPDQERIWRRLLRNQHRIARAHETMALARHRLEVVQRELGTQTTRLLPPR